MIIITIVLSVAFVLACLRWFFARGGAPFFLKRIDLVVITGAALACWVGYLAALALLPALFALAFAVGVELYIRQCRQRWARPGAVPVRRPDPAQPAVARAERIAEPTQICVRSQTKALPAPTTSRPALARPKR